MKETFYFSHDYNARNDEKIIKLISTLGYEGYGLYWAIIEMLYENGGFLEYNLDTLAFALRTDSERIAKLFDGKLFVVSKEKFYSKSVLARLSTRKGKSEKARQSAIIRWDKQKKKDANALRTQCERNAIKESKVKESKVNNIVATKVATQQVLELSKLLLQEIKNNIPTFKNPNINEWCKHVDRMIRIDGRTAEQIEYLIKWCQQDNFWQGNILSTKKLREKFDTLTAQAKRQSNNLTII